MANLKKSGRQCLAAVLLCVSLLGKMQAAEIFVAAPAGAGQTAGAGQAENTETGQTAEAGAGQTADIGMEPASDAGMPPAADVRAVRAEAGVIEVLSGFVDAKGIFWKMKSGSGFLIANKESATFIITNSSNVTNTPRQIKKFCKKNSIDIENMQPVNSIRVVITGDVTAEAEVVVKSAEKDYCVLSAANVVSQKESLKLGDGAGLAVNDLVYAYGFPEQADTAENTMQYSEIDVRSMQGAVIQTEAYLENGAYLAHSAPVMQGMAGGPLLDADGYVVGVNCAQSPENDTGVAYALPIHEISAVLDNFSIYYGSRAVDEARAQLEAAYRECTDMQAAGGYKKASMEALAQALDAAEEMRSQEEPNAADLLNEAQLLYAARDAMVPKTKTITILILVFAALDVIMFIWMLILAVKNAQEKKQMEMQRVQPAVQDMGYARQQAQNAGMPRPQSAGMQRVQNAAYGTDDFRRPAPPPAGRRLRIIRQKTGQTAVLNKNQFIVGKSQSLADFCLADNQTISRKHAMLFEENGGWYVDDLNSLNGTCVNGKKVVPGQAVRLNSGDEITLSDEAFLVQE